MHRFPLKHTFSPTVAVRDKISNSGAISERATDTTMKSLDFLLVSVFEQRRFMKGQAGKCQDILSLEGHGLAAGGS